MTVASTTNRKTYTGDNVSTSFATSPVIFYLTSNLQVRVTVIATGVSTLLTENTHYTVSGGAATGATGTVNLAGGSSPHGALLSTEKLVILRVLPLTQASDFVNNNNSDAEVLEAALDKLTDVDQQLSERQDRAITFPEGDVSGSTTTLQDASVRAGRLLGFDALGVLTTIVMTVGTSLVDFATSAGSTFIGWIQTGAGAVLRTISDKLRDQVSIFDYMTAAQRADVLAGTALLDVGAAITAAIAAVPSTGGTLIGPSGTYTYATSPNFAKQNLSIVMGQGTIFKHTGTGNAFNCDAGANPAFVNAMRIENIQVQGNANSTNTIYMRGIGRSIFKNFYPTGGATTGAALRTEFCLLNTWENFKATNQAPCPLHGILLTRRDVGENTTTQTFINPIIEGMTTVGGSGIYIDWAATNVFIDGTSESNRTGLTITANGPGFNSFYGLDLESNVVADMDVSGVKNNFYSVLSLGTTALSATAVGNSFFGGEYTVFTLNASASRNKLLGLEIATSLTSNPPSTTIFDCYVNGAYVNSQLSTGMKVSGQVQSARSASDTLSDANAFLKAYDATLGAGLFGQQKLSSPFQFVLTVSDTGLASFFPLGFHAKLYPATDGNAVQTACGFYAGTGVPNNANGANGDVYWRSDGGAGTTMYQRRAGAWVATGA